MRSMTQVMMGLLGTVAVAACASSTAPMTGDVLADLPHAEPGDVQFGGVRTAEADDATPETALDEAFTAVAKEGGRLFRRRGNPAGLGSLALNFIQLFGVQQFVDV